MRACRRFLVSVTVTRLVQRRGQSVARFFASRPRELPDWPFSKRVCSGGVH
jgi:hypothetical protein